MTGKDRLVAYVRDLADRLDLRDWEIVLQDGPPENDALLAAVSVIRGRRLATLHVCADWWDRRPEERRCGIVHELIHLYVEPILVTMEAGAEAMPQSAFKVLYHAVDMQSEFAVDGIARAIAGFFPLPESEP